MRPVWSFPRGRGALLELDEDHVADVELGAEIMRGEGLMRIDRFTVQPVLQDLR